MHNNLFDILKYAEIKREDVQSIDEKEIIRIEKKLRTAEKLHEEVSRDEVERTLEALKNHLYFVKSIYADELLYKLFHGIRFEDRDFVPFYKREEELAGFQAFFSLYLEEDLLAEFKEMVMNEEFATLVFWQKARNLFSISFRHQFHQFLMNRLMIIKDTLVKRPSSWELSNKISYATSKHFYALLGEEDDVECDKLINEILNFYKLNSGYTKGRDFTDRIIHAMYHYKPNDSLWTTKLMMTGLTYAGSNRVGVIAFFVIAAVSIFIVYGLASWTSSGSNKNRKTGNYGYSVDEREMKDRAQKVVQYIQSRNINDFKKMHSGTIEIGQCDNILKERFSKLNGGGFDFVIAPAIGLRTGENLYVNPPAGNNFDQLRWSVRKGIKNIKVFNATGQQVLLFVYVTNCVPDRNDPAHCLKNTAYNEVYIAAGDTLEFDNDFDSLSFRTGAALYKLGVQKGKANSKADYSFCPFTSLDSVLYKHTFCSRDINAGLEGMLTLKKIEGAYSVTWKGAKEAIFHRNMNAFLKPGKTVSIRFMKRKVH